MLRALIIFFDETGFFLDVTSMEPFVTKNFKNTQWTDLNDIKPQIIHLFNIYPVIFVVSYKFSVE